MALYSQRHFNTLHLTSVPCSVFSSFHALSTSSILLPYPESSAKIKKYRTWRFIGPRQLVRVWSINWLLYWAGRGNVALSLWWSPLSLWNRRGFCPGELEVETRDSTNLSDFIMWFHMISWVLDGFSNFMTPWFLAIFLWSFAKFPVVFLGFLVHRYLQDQVQHFNARAEDYHRRHGDETSPFQACLLGTAQRDETIIKNAVGGEYCASTFRKWLVKMQRGRWIVMNCIGLIIWITFTSIYKATLIVWFQSRGKPAPMLTEGCFPFVRGRA